VRRPTGLVQRQRCHERHLVLRAAARLAPRALLSEVGVVQLHRAFQKVRGLPIRHGAVAFLVQQPRSEMAQAPVVLERKRLHPRLRLADEMDGQEPDGQLQLGMPHRRAGRHRCLMPAADALEKLAGALTDEVVPRVVSVRAAEALGRTRPLPDFGALRFDTKVTQEFGA
jgi:hypothetical protein